MNSYSQKGFYLRSLVERKFNANNGSPYDITTAQGYTIKVTPYRLYLLGRYIGSAPLNSYYFSVKMNMNNNRGVNRTTDVVVIRRNY